MQRPLAGTVEILGQDVRSRTPEWLARHLSIVLTEPIDAGALTARELVGLGRYPFTDWLGRLTEVDRARVEAAMAAVDATAIADRGVRSLSDGERQRVLIARALAQEPRLVILDEPTAYLDLPRRIETLGLLRRLVRENGISVLLSTHHLDLALSHADGCGYCPWEGRSPSAHLRTSRCRARSSAPSCRTAWCSTAARERSDCARSRCAPRSCSRAMAWLGDGSSAPCGGRAWPRSMRRAPPPATSARRRRSRRRSRRSGSAENAPRYLLEIDGERVECASLHDSRAAAQGDPRQSSASRPYMSSSRSSSSFNTAWRCRP